MKKIAVYFPGIGYHCDKPLLYYSRNAAYELGYENYKNVAYTYKAGNIRGNEAKIKEAPPNATKVPDRPQLDSTTDQLERSNTKDKIFIELLLSLVASSARSHRHLQAGFGSICEPRGLSNLAPSRSRLFKLMGKVKV